MKTIDKLTVEDCMAVTNKEVLIRHVEDLDTGRTKQVVYSANRFKIYVDGVRVTITYSVDNVVDCFNNIKLD